MRHQRARHLGVRLAAIVGIVALAAFVAACGSSGGKSTSSSTTSSAAVASHWTQPNGDLTNTRRVGGPIDSSSVSKLAVAWTLPITGGSAFGTASMTPVVKDGTAYLQDLSSNVQAVDMASGKLKWEHKYDTPDIGPNGVAVDGTTVFGATNTDAFALDAATGKQLWKVKLTLNPQEGIDMAPIVHDGRVYVSTVPGSSVSNFYVGNQMGILHALDAKTGKDDWTFNTAPIDQWSKQNTKINSGGGLWHTPGFDGKGKVYIDVANPAPFPGTDALPWGSSRPGPNPYTDSVVQLDEATGKLGWSYQVIPHDIYDWDLQLPPIIVDHGGKQLVLAAGKGGQAVAVDRSNGKLVWKTPVGTHNGHDQDPIFAMNGQLDKLKLPETVYPGILGGVETQMAVNGDTLFLPIVNLPTTFTTQSKRTIDFTGGTGEMVALDIATGKVKWDKKFAKPAYGAASVVNDLVFTTTFDGTLRALSTKTGDEVWSQKLPAGTNAPVAIDGDTVLVAASFPQGKTQKAQWIAYRIGGGASGSSSGTSTTAGGTSTSAAADGKSVFSQNCASCHTLAAAGASGSVGPNLDQLKPDQARVQRQVENGGAGMPSFSGRLSPAEIAAVSQYVSQNAGKGGSGSGSSSSSGGGGTP